MYLKIQLYFALNVAWIEYVMVNVNIQYVVLKYIVLSVPITFIVNVKYNNLMKFIFDEYFTTSKISCDDIRCKERIINYYLITFIMIFRFQKYLFS